MAGGHDRRVTARVVLAGGPRMTTRREVHTWRVVATSAS
jgi:hypothetical protein